MRTILALLARLFGRPSRRRAPRKPLKPLPHPERLGLHIADATARAIY